MREKSSVRWPHSDNKPGKSLSLEPFRNSTVVYTGGGWVGQDMQRACILQHLIMNTKHKQCQITRANTYTSTLPPGPKSVLSFILAVTLGGNASFCGPIRRSLCLNFKVKFLYTTRELSNTTILSVSSTEHSPPGTDASGWLVCLAAGPSPATTSTWPEFSVVEGYNSPKVAA